jgi:hypothetical protein
VAQVAQVAVMEVAVRGEVVAQVVKVMEQAVRQALVL